MVNDCVIADELLPIETTHTFLSVFFFRIVEERKKNLYIMTNQFRHRKKGFSNKNIIIVSKYMKVSFCLYRVFKAMNRFQMKLFYTKSIRRNAHIFNGEENNLLFSMISFKEMNLKT